MCYDPVVPKKVSAAVKTTVKLDGPLYERVQAERAKERLTLQEFIVKAVTEYLKRK